MGKRRYFGTDGIRGRVGQGAISADFVLKLGWAVGRALSRDGRRPTVVIGKDTRISGYMFESALQAGLVASGSDVRLLGPMPTPGVAYLTHSLRADAGIVISASHNAHHDNGIKFFSERGEKLDDATEAAIEAAMEEAFDTVESEALGKAARVTDAATRYAEFCKSTVPLDFSLEGWHLGLDCAHGAAYQIAPRVLTELGARVDAIGIQPDGLNINRGFGSTQPEALARRVRERGATLGIALDGDGDRVILVDSAGRVVDGDAQLYILACDWQQTGRLRGPVAGTLMTNFALEQALEKRGIGFVRTRVGDRYVHQALAERGGVLGGEASGHILCLDRASTGDAIVSALQVLEVLVRRNWALEDALADYQPLPQRTINVPGHGAAVLEHPEVLIARQAAERRLSGQGRLVLRASGTEPVIRVTVEAADAALVEDVLQDLARAVRSVV